MTKKKLPILRRIDLISETALTNWMQDVADFFDLDATVFYDSKPHPEEKQIDYISKPGMLMINEADKVEALIAFMNIVFEILSTEPELRSRIEDESTIAEYFRKRKGKSQ